MIKTSYLVVSQSWSCLWSVWIMEIMEAMNIMIKATVSDRPEGQRMYHMKQKLASLTSPHIGFDLLKMGRKEPSSAKYLNNHHLPTCLCGSKSLVFVSNTNHESWRCYQFISLKEAEIFRSELYTFHLRSMYKLLCLSPPKISKRKPPKNSTRPKVTL